MAGTCKVDQCVRPVYVQSRGWCSMHYNRWSKHGTPTPEGLRVVGNDKARLDAKTDKSAGGCWNWVGLFTKNGYPLISINRRARLAHRITYEMAVGPIPDSYEVDHLCRNIICVKPDHLEAVTKGENRRRQATANGGLNRICKVEGCGRPHRCFDLCNMHFQRWNKAGRPEIIPS